VFSQIPKNHTLSRKWICQCNVLLNHNTKDNDKVQVKLAENKKRSDEGNELKEKDEKHETKLPFKRISPIDFINQSKVKVPEDWRKDEQMPGWKRQKFALLEKFKGDQWNPTKRISREQMDSVKMLKKAMPDMTNTQLAEQFKISPEAVRRILKSKWTPSIEEEEKLFERWKKRGEKVKEIMKEKYEKNDQDIPLQSKVIIKSGKISRVKIRKFNNKSSSTSNLKDQQKFAKKAGQQKQKKFMKKTNKFKDMIF